MNLKQFKKNGFWGVKNIDTDNVIFDATELNKDDFLIENNRFVKNKNTNKIYFVKTDDTVEEKKYDNILTENDIVDMFLEKNTTLFNEIDEKCLFCYSFQNEDVFIWVEDDTIRELFRKEINTPFEVLENPYEIVFGYTTPQQEIEVYSYTRKKFLFSRYHVTSVHAIYLFQKLFQITSTDTTYNVKLALNGFDVKDFVCLSRSYGVDLYYQNSPFHIEYIFIRTGFCRYSYDKNIMCVVKDRGKDVYGLYSFTTDQLIIPCEYQKFEMGTYSDFIIFKSKEKTIVVDKDGKIRITAEKNIQYKNYHFICVDNGKTRVYDSKYNQTVVVDMEVQNIFDIYGRIYLFEIDNKYFLYKIEENQLTKLSDEELTNNFDFDNSNYAIFFFMKNKNLVYYYSRQQYKMVELKNYVNGRLRADVAQRIIKKEFLTYEEISNICEAVAYISKNTREEKLKVFEVIGKYSLYNSDENMKIYKSKLGIRTNDVYSTDWNEVLSKIPKEILKNTEIFKKVQQNVSKHPLFDIWRK